MINKKQWKQVETLLNQGFSIDETARFVGISKPSVYKFVKNRKKFFSNIPHQKVSESKKIRQYDKFITSQIKKGNDNGNNIFRELQEIGYAGSYSTLNRYINKRRKEIANKNYKPAIHLEAKPGEEAQVDWGHFGKIIINGKTEKLSCFVYILSYSRALYIEFAIKQNQQTLQECHMNAFHKLGIPSIIRYDNMKTVVLKRVKLEDSSEKISYNPSFTDFAKFFGFEIAPCHPYWPRSKGKVESAVKYVRNNFWKGLIYKKDSISLQELNKKAWTWLDNVANARVHKGTYEIPYHKWKKEKEYLTILPREKNYTTSPFVARFSTKDCLVQYKSNFYFIPEEFARRKVLVKELNESGIVFIEIYFEDQIIAKYQLSAEKGKWITYEDSLIKLSTYKDRKKKYIYKGQDEYLFVPQRALNYYDQFID